MALSLLGHLLSLLSLSGDHGSPSGALPTGLCVFRSSEGFLPSLCSWAWGQVAVAPLFLALGLLSPVALGSDPHTEMKSYEAGGVRLKCMSVGWYPPPQIQWRDTGGQSLPAEAVDEPADPRGLYAVSASVILEGGPAEVSCVIRNPLLGQEKSVGLSIPGSFFRDSLPSVAFLALVLLLLPLMLLLLYLLRRWPKRIRALSQDKEEEHELRMQQHGQSCSGSEVPQRRCRTSQVDNDLVLTTHEQDLLRIRAGGSQK